MSVTIKSQNLILNSLKPEDAERMFHYRSNPSVSQFQNWEPKSIEEVNAFIAGVKASEFNQAGIWYQLAIRSKANEDLLGDIGLHFIAPEAEQVEFGVSLSPVQQGRGIATEALSTVISYLFVELDKHRIIASVDPRNLACMALMKRLGLRQEAYFKKSFRFKGEWADDVIFAILKEEWNSNRGS